MRTLLNHIPHCKNDEFRPKTMTGASRTFNHYSTDHNTHTLHSPSSYQQVYSDHNQNICSIHRGAKFLPI
jgi:hypothetical protein